jgi:hypothetical protein
MQHPQIDAAEPRLAANVEGPKGDCAMRPLLLWLIGIPIPLIIILWLFGAF